MNADDQATQIALEHCDWARREGMKPIDVRASLSPAFDTRIKSFGWDDAVDVVAIAWLMLARGFNQRVTP